LRNSGNSKKERGKGKLKKPCPKEYYDDGDRGK